MNTAEQILDAYKAFQKHTDYKFNYDTEIEEFMYGLKDVAVKEVMVSGDVGRIAVTCIFDSGFIIDCCKSRITPQGQWMTTLRNARKEPLWQDWVDIVDVGKLYAETQEFQRKLREIR